MARDLLVDPRLRVPYYTYVLRGFLDSGIATHVRFKRLDAPLGPVGSDGAAMILASPTRRLRFFVSTGDHNDINEAMLDWADAYGKVNLAFDEPPRSNLIPVGPVFGITLWPLPAGYAEAFQMALAGAPLMQRVREIRFQAIARLPFERYTARPSEPSYVFHASRPWSGKHQGTNDARERFLRACRGLGIDVDGGILDERLSLGSYLDRLQRSAIAFNCPAVHHCHGWKLGEYLALGKAIVSTPLSRQLPAPLVHGEHVHFVDDREEAIADGVASVLADASYRAHLEAGARRWFDEHLAPVRVVDRLVDVAS